MNRFIIPKIQIDAVDFAAIDNKLSGCAALSIECVNWPEQYPSKPEVSVRVAHNGDCLFLQYSVSEEELRANVMEDNGEVWTDSCVEFFIAFDAAHYYNVECTCIGTALLGHREIGEPTSHGSAETMRSILRSSSLERKLIPNTKGDFQWKLTLVIPCTAFWKDKIGAFDGKTARGNFYKCGDKLSMPHFVSWTTIDTPGPSFHQPKYFGELVFGE